MRTKSKQGHKTIVSTCTYSRDGNYVTLACQDGSIQLWDRRKLFVSMQQGFSFMPNISGKSDHVICLWKLSFLCRRLISSNILEISFLCRSVLLLLVDFVETLKQLWLYNYCVMAIYHFEPYQQGYACRKYVVDVCQVNPAMMNRTAHMNGTDTSCLCYSYDGRTLASRGGMPNQHANKTRWCLTKLVYAGVCEIHRHCHITALIACKWKWLMDLIKEFCSASPSKRHASNIINFLSVSWCKFNFIISTSCLGAAVVYCSTFITVLLLDSLSLSGASLQLRSIFFTRLG